MAETSKKRNLQDVDKSYNNHQSSSYNKNIFSKLINGKKMSSTVLKNKIKSSSLDIQAKIPINNSIEVNKITIGQEVKENEKIKTENKIIESEYSELNMQNLTNLVSKDENTHQERINTSMLNDNLNAFTDRNLATPSGINMNKSLDKDCKVLEEIQVSDNKTSDNVYNHNKTHKNILNRLNGDDKNSLFIPNMDESTIEKAKISRGNEDDSMIDLGEMNERRDTKNNNNKTDPNNGSFILRNIPTSQKLALKDGHSSYSKNNNHSRSHNSSNIKLENKKQSTLSDNGKVCRICYEEDSEEKGGLISPCTCTGSCKYIHESCLKKWIENNFAMNKFQAECEICKSVYIIKFYMKHRFSQKKIWASFKSLVAFSIITSVIIVLIFTVIFVIITAMATMTDQEKGKLINILTGIGAGFLFISILIAFRNCKKHFYEVYMYDWRIFNIDGTENQKSVQLMPFQINVHVNERNSANENHLMINNSGNLERNSNDRVNPSPILMNHLNLRVIEHESSNEEHRVFDIVNGSASVIRHDNYPLIINQDQIVVLDG